MPERRKASPLRELRDQLSPRVRRAPTALRVDPTLPGEAGEETLVFCPKLKHATQYLRRRLPPGRYNRGGMCGDVNCGRCPVLLADLEERSPDYAWVCSSCTDGFYIEPYWTDGACVACGFQSSVLMLATPR